MIDWIGNLKSNYISEKIKLYNIGFKLNKLTIEEIILISGIYLISDINFLSLVYVIV